MRVVVGTELEPMHRVIMIKVLGLHSLGISSVANYMLNSLFSKCASNPKR